MSCPQLWFHTRGLGAQPVDMICSGKKRQGERDQPLSQLQALPDPGFRCLSGPPIPPSLVVCRRLKFRLTTHLITIIWLWDTVPETDSDVRVLFVPLAPREILAWGSLWPSLPTSPPNLAVRPGARQDMEPKGCKVTGAVPKVQSLRNQAG